jgi:8-oxo-dGTP pyrophosphatase MutT (NUDIX family)
MAVQRRVAAVGYRLGTDGVPEFLLVRARAGGRWTFPKGKIEPDDATPADAAEREASEEAGITGLVDPIPLCTYTHLAHLGGEYYREQSVEAYLLKITGPSGHPEPGRRPTWFAEDHAVAALTENQITSTYALEVRRVIYTALERIDISSAAQAR